MEKIELKKIDEVVYHDITDEGMHIYLCPNYKTQNFYMTLNIRYGSIHTTFKPNGSKSFLKTPNGIAHFLEHLMFYQPDNTTAHEYFTKLGSSINACTTNDFTFYEVFASNHFKENLEYLLDYVNTPYFTKDNIKTERGIITQEIKMYEDNKTASLIYKTHECLWQKNNRKYLISGTVDDIKKINVEDVYNVYNNFYHPANMFVVITGNFNIEETIAIIKQNQKKKNFPKYKAPVIKEVKEPSKVAVDLCQIPCDVQIPKVKIATKIPLNIFKISKEELTYYLTLILRVNFGATSQFYEELLNSNLISSSLSYSASVYEQYAILTIGFNSMYPDEVIQKIKYKLENLTVSKEELERKIKSYISSLVLTFDNIEAVNNLLQNYLITYDKIIDDDYEIIKNLDIDVLNDIIKSLKFNNQTIVKFVKKVEE